MMTGNEVGVKVSIDNVPNLQTIVLTSVKVGVGVTLSINDRCDACRTNQIGRVRQTPQTEMLHERMPYVLPSVSLRGVKPIRAWGSITAQLGLWISL